MVGLDAIEEDHRIIPEESNNKHLKDFYDWWKIASCPSAGGNGGSRGGGSLC
jgi:hypothetical protein